MIRARVFLLISFVSQMLAAQPIVDAYGAIIRSDTTAKHIYLCFTGHDFHEGFNHVLKVLQEQEIVASFFLTGDFVRNQENLVKEIAIQGHYIGAHSDHHLLYCDWEKRDSLLYTPEKIKTDIVQNLEVLQALEIWSTHFMPPYEWYNQKVIEIAHELNQVVVNFSPGTRSNADYTTPDLPGYVSSIEILESIYSYEESQGLNGFHLLIHPGTNPQREDKLYLHLDRLLVHLKARGYEFLRF